MQQVLAVFTEGGTPKTGLSATVKVYRLDTNAVVVNGEAMTEVGEGQYVYDFSTWDSAINYSTICDSVTLTGHERYAYGAISASRIIEDTLSEDDILRILLAKATGIAAGGGGTVISFADIANAKSRVQMTVDSSGNRSSVILDGS
jgi:hypothetical protein